MHWVKDHKKLLANCHRALKENGIIRFNFAVDGNCSNFYEVIKEVMRNKNYKKYFLSFEWPWFMPAVEEYKSLVTGTDFKDVEVWHENADRYFATKDEMIKWIGSGRQCRGYAEHGIINSDQDKYSVICFLRAYRSRLAH